MIRWFLDWVYPLEEDPEIVKALNMLDIVQSPRQAALVMRFIERRRAELAAAGRVSIVERNDGQLSEAQ